MPGSRRPDLGTMQRWMSCITRYPGPAARAIRSGVAAEIIPTTEAASGRVVKPSQRMNLAQRLEVYREGYTARLVGALRADFPGLIHALGDHRFYEVGEAYVFANPSRDPNLTFFSRYMDEFLDGRVDLPNREFLVELARLELAMLFAFHAKRATPFDPESLAHLAPEDWNDVVLHTHPSLHVLATSFPVSRYLQAVFDGQEPAGVPPREASFVAVYRRDYRVWRAPLTPGGHAMLSAIHRGETFGQALDAAGDEAEQAGAWLQQWVADGLFAAPAATDR